MEVKDFKLPLGIVSQVELVRAARELEALEQYYLSTPSQSSEPANLSRGLQAIAAENGVDLGDKKQRQELLTLLGKLKTSAPLIHISFATEPSIRALEPIVTWLRQNIHPHVVLQVGLQPTIAAGCVVRTPNRVFDLSLRPYLLRQYPYLMQLIQGATRG